MNQSAPNQPPYPPPAQPNANHRTPFLAGALSVVPGLGNIYNGLYQRGFLFFLVVTGIFAMAVQHEGPELALLIPTMMFFWLFNIFDAYRQAIFINHGYTSATPTEMPQSSSGGSLALGVAVFLVGLYGLLREVLDFDFTILLDYWYLGFLAFGAWSIYRALRAEKDKSEAPAEDLPTALTTPPSDPEEDTEE
jgi:hypothetical protein